MEGGRGWGAKGVCVLKRAKEAGRKRESEREREGGWRVLVLLMGKEGRG